MKGKKVIARTGVVLAATAIGGMIAVQPAAAHAASWTKVRSSCMWSGGVDSGHSYAWTRKDLGSCAGHAWLRVTFANNTSSGARHSATRVEIYGNIKYAYHKTQENEGWGRSH